jgi:hypothetical protein
MSAMQLQQQAQLYSDRAALMQVGNNPQLAQLAARGQSTLIGLWQQVNIHAATDTYNNVFLVTGALTLVGAVLAAMLLPSGSPTAGRK